VGHLEVLCYHRVGGTLELGVTRLGRRAFVRHVANLARQGWETLSLEEALRRERDGTVGPKMLLVTFDDGYASLERCALPALREAGLRATLFVVTDFVGGANDWDLPYAGRQRLLDWDALERWHARGFDVGSHTATHPRLDWLSDEAALEELARSRETLVRRLGPAAGLGVAYPFGRADARIRSLAARAGYTIGFGLPDPGPREPLCLPRAPVYVWELGRMPFALGQGSVGGAARAVASRVSRCAIGTPWVQRLLGLRYRT